MFFDSPKHVIELLGVFKIKRNFHDADSASGRFHDTLSIRLSGNCCFTTKNYTVEVFENDLLYIPNNINYHQHTDGEEIIAVHFINYTKETKTAIEVFTHDNPEEIKKTFESMYKLWNLKKPGYYHRCTSMLYSVLELAAQKSGEHTFPTEELNHIMNEAINYIHKNYKRNDISVSEILKKLFISDSYFRRLFKKSYGMSPNDYIISLKLDYAAQLLASGHYSVTDASSKIGYQDPKYFSRIFKKRYHLTPSEYRKSFE